MTVTVPRCDQCHRMIFPPRALCPHCGNDSFGESPIQSANVVSVTAVHRAFGESFPDPIRLCLVAHEDLHLVARSIGRVAEGETVELSRTGCGRLTARPVQDGPAGMGRNENPGSRSAGVGPSASQGRQDDPAPHSGEPS